MTHSIGPRRVSLSGRQRLAVGALGVGLLVPLLVARLLVPDAHGYGTHQQFGLPPCTIVALCGCRCPTCGMTTAWAHVVRGEVREAVEANWGGAVLAVLALVAVPWLWGSAACGRWLGVAPSAAAGAWLGLAVLGLTLVDWAVRQLAQ